MPTALSFVFVFHGEPYTCGCLGPVVRRVARLISPRTFAGGKLEVGRWVTLPFGPLPERTRRRVFESLAEALAWKGGRAVIAVGFEGRSLVVHLS